MQKPRVVRHEVVQPQDQSIRLIALTKGQNAIVDAADYDWLMQWNWTAQYHKKRDCFYAFRQIRSKDAVKMVYMHNLIAGCNPAEFADHKNHLTLDNRRLNLRRCTQGQNNANKPLSKKSTSGYKGVYAANGRWCSGISVGNRHVNLGYFDTKEDAAKAYDTAAVKFYGEFAHLNFPPETEKTPQLIAEAEESYDLLLLE